MIEYTPEQLIKLKAELKSNKLKYFGKSHQEIAQILNTSGGDKVDASEITADKMVAALDMDEYVSMSDKTKDFIFKVLLLGTIRPQAAIANLRKIIEIEFSTLPKTTAQLLAITFKDATIAESLGLPPCQDVDVKRIIKPPTYTQELL